VKKLLIAVLVILVLIAVSVVGVGYYAVNKARSFFQPLQQYSALNKNITKTTPFSAPANGELTADMVKRFATVQETMVAKLGPVVDEMKSRQDAFLKSQEDEHRHASATESFSVITDMMKFILQAKTAQVDALNQSHFSLEEYDWVRGRIYAAAGMSLGEMGLAQLEDALKASGAMGDAAKDLRREVTSSEPVPDHNKKLVAPYLPKLKEWAVFGFFGL
jgi:hypothetical protein